MKIFISWSGERSKNFAEFLQNWLGNIIQSVDPFLSGDIDKGSKWGPKISQELQESKLGILCLTPENIHSEWIIFEAGALSKLGDKVCPILINIDKSSIELPLSQFQCTLSSDKKEMRGLLFSINNEIAELYDKDKNQSKPLPESRLNELIEHFWSEFESKITEINNMEISEESSIVIDENNKIIEEILTIVRAIDYKLTYEPTQSHFVIPKIFSTMLESASSDKMYREGEFATFSPRNHDVP